MKNSPVSVRYLSVFLLTLTRAFPESYAGEAPKSSTSLATATTTPSPARTTLFADFEEGKSTTVSGVPWEVFTDSTMGGKSSLQLTVTTDGANGSKRGLRLTAKLTPDFQWGGFVGVRAWLQADGAAKDMSQVLGVQFYARGDGKTYRLLVARDNVKNGNHFAAEFTAPAEWSLVRVPFSKLAQSPYMGGAVPWSPTNVTGVGFLARGEPGATAEARLEVDDIRFYQEK